MLILTLIMEPVVLVVSLATCSQPLPTKLARGKHQQGNCLANCETLEAYLKKQKDNKTMCTKDLKNLKAGLQG